MRPGGSRISVATMRSLRSPRRRAISRARVPLATASSHLTEQRVGDRHERRDPAAPALVVQLLGQDLGLPQDLQYLPDLAELVEGRPQLETNVEGLLQGGLVLRKVSQRGEGALEAGHLRVAPDERSVGGHGAVRAG